MMKSAVETFRASVVVLVLDRTHNLRWWLYPGVMLLALGAFNLQRFVRLLASTHSK